MRDWKLASLVLLSLLLGKQEVQAQQSASSAQALAAAERLILAGGFDEASFAPPKRSTIDSVRDSSIMAECAANAAEHPTEQIDCKANLKMVSQMKQSFWALRDQQKLKLLHAAESAYAAHLSIDEMKTAAAFFESSTGQHLIAALPAIAADYGAEDQRIMAAALGIPKSK